VTIAGVRAERPLEGRRALVTGAGTGLGRVIALHMAAAGADVALHYAHGASAAEAVVRQACDAGVRAAVFYGDFAKREAPSALAARAEAFLGGVDILVNNAGITLNRPFEQVAAAEFDLLYRVNVGAPFFLTQALLPTLQASRAGTVINLASIHALGGRRDYSVYAGTKGALVALTRQLAIELAPRGVRVNAIAPGLVEVPSYYEADPTFDAEAAGRTIPAGFAGQPEDVARLAVFLASDEARFIVGQTLVIDGGTTAWFSFTDDFDRPAAGVWGGGSVPGR
jgi:NAD(P)-dependent dehydrogenase (short-subunit alcohol dehydrogenase family)